MKNLYTTISPGVFEEGLKKKLREYMDKNNLSQRELAQKLLITEIRMSRIMRGDISLRRFDIVTFLNIAVILGITPEELMQEVIGNEN